MILSEITSGFGNQLFQYAAGYGLACRHRTALRLDTRFFRGDRARRYELGRLDISASEITVVDRLRFSMGRPERATRMSRRAAGLIPGLPLHVVDDAEAGVDASVLDAPDGTALRGFWQNEGYFLHSQDGLRREFAFKEPPNAENAAVIARIRDSRSVCIHIRRGDYLNPAEKLSPAPLAYYDAAVAWFRKRFDDITFFVFGDEPGWIRANLRLPGAIHVSHNVGVNDPEDLRLMSCCDHFIIANSTFSWWGAWLAANPEKIVIAPRPWFSRPHRNEDHIVPDRWIRL